MAEIQPKTKLQQLQAKCNGIQRRLQDPLISPDEKERAQARLKETQEELERLTNQRMGLLKALVF